MMFNAFPNTKPLAFDETYASLTGIIEGVAIYPMFSKVRVGKRAAQLADNAGHFYT